MNSECFSFVSEKVPGGPKQFQTEDDGERRQKGGDKMKIIDFDSKKKGS